MNPIPKLVCSKNDLEAKFIQELCEKRQEEIEFLDLALDWGGTPDFSSEPIKSLLYPEKPGHILLVEIPSLELEERLQAAGHRVVVIDHHSILSPGHGLIKRFSRKSSVEQIVDYMGWKLEVDEDKRMREVAANDTGSWFGLMKHFAELPVDKASEQSGRVRKEEQDVRKKIASKNTDGKDKESGSPAATSQNKPKPVTPVTRKLETGLGGGRGAPFYFKTCAVGTLEETAEEFQRELAIELHEASIAGTTFAYEKYNEKIDKEIANGKKPRSKKTKDDLEKEILEARRSIDPPEILYLEVKPGITENQPDTIKGLFFTCGKAGVSIIRDILETKAASSPADLTIVTGGNHERGYLYAFGENEGELSSLADLILDNCLHGVKPLRAWQTTFIQAITVPAHTIDASNKKLQGKICRHTKEQPGCQCCKRLRELQDAEDKRQTEKEEERRDYFKDYELRLQHMFGLVETSKSARNYLLPALRSNMAPTVGEASAALKQMKGNEEFLHPLISWNIPLNESWFLSLQNLREIEDSKPKHYEASPHGLHLSEPFKSLTLHWGYDNMVFLEWRFGDEALTYKENRDADSTWRFLLSGETGNANPIIPHKVSTIAQALDFNYGARQCYSAGKRGPSDQRRITLQRMDGNKTLHCKTDFGITEDETTRLTGWFAAMADAALSHFKSNFCPPVNHTDPQVNLLLDERARFIATIVPVGQPPSLKSGIARGEVIEARFAGGDDFSDTHFYSRDFAIAELNRGKYTRFSPGSTHYATSHSFSLIAYGWFGPNVGIIHMREHYARMFLVLQASVSTFQKLWADLMRITASEARADDGFERESLASNAAKQRRKMMEFSNVYWFHSLSSQMQGEELFAKMRAELPVEREHADLSEEISDTERTLEAERAIKAEAARDRYALMFGILAVFVALFEIADKLIGWGAITGDKDPASPQLSLDALSGFATGTGWFVTALIVIGVILIVTNRLVYSALSAFGRAVRRAFSGLVG